MKITALIQLLLLITYGLRLGLYLSFREGRTAYRRELQDVKNRGSDIGLLKKAAIWVGVAVLYVMMISPVLYRARADIDGRYSISALAWSGTAVMTAGLLLEGLADLQKTRFKTANPDRFCDVGLFRMVRCPNYLGEILFWTGSLIAGAASIKGIFPWAAGVVSWVCITLIMLGSTKRLEAKQEDRYGNLEDFQAWCRSTPVLFPLVPVYTLKNVRVYLE
jgi:steroid 5-alpha reductase family enzyme